jgi:hypothetical protein
MLLATSEYSKRGNLALLSSDVGQRLPEEKKPAWQLPKRASQQGKSRVSKS